MITGYKIAVASSDGASVDLSFGRADRFLIFEVGEDGSCRLAETREVQSAAEGAPSCARREDGNPRACGGHGGGHDARADLLRDCRAVLCAKIGPQARKVLEHRATSVFDVNMTIDEAFEKIIPYFDRIDHHRRLRG